MFSDEINPYDSVSAIYSDAYSPYTENHIHIVTLDGNYRYGDSFTSFDDIYDDICVKGADTRLCMISIGNLEGFRNLQGFRQLFDSDKELDSDFKLEINSEVKDILQPETEGNYLVILHNDPINGVEFVTDVIKKVFGYGTGKSIWLMLKAHFTGKSVLWIGAKSKAIDKQQRMISFGPDPRMIHRGAQPLTVTVEKDE